MLKIRAGLGRSLEPENLAPSYNFAPAFSQKEIPKPSADCPSATTQPLENSLLSTQTLAGIAPHEESAFVDFDQDGLLFWSVCNEGPALATADVNGDGLADFYQGGAKGKPGQLYVQHRAGGFVAVASDLWASDSGSEDTDALFFDADGDGDLDLYVCSGSNEHDRTSIALMDRLYLNQGNGRWEKSPQLLPSSSRPVSSSCVAAFDYDGDGDLDLFVGGRLRPQLYGVPTDSYLLDNQGKGDFKPKNLPELNELGMVTAALWAELDEHPGVELVLAGEWMPITIFSFHPDGQLRQKTAIPNSHGLWYSLALLDVDGQGQLAIAAGNHGLNSRLKASVSAPLVLHVNDFDGNGRAEQLLCFTDPEGQLVPWALKDDLVKQLPALRKGLLRYDEYAGKHLGEIFPEAVLARSKVSQVEQLGSTLYRYTPGEGFQATALPMEAQLFPVYAIAVADINQDGFADLLLGGNQRIGKPEMGIYAAGFGQLLLGQADGTFLAPSPSESGLILDGETRSIQPLGKNTWLVGRNDAAPLLVKTKLRSMER